MKQRPDSQALDYSVCSGPRSVIVSSNHIGHHDPASVSNGRATHGPLVHGAADGNRMEEEEDDTPMICMICEDKATGLHYGIITCEG